MRNSTKQKEEVQNKTKPYSPDLSDHINPGKEQTAMARKDKEEKKNGDQTGQEAQMVQQQQTGQEAPVAQQQQPEKSTDERPYLHRSQWVNDRMLVTSRNGEAQTYLDMILSTGVIPKNLPDIKEKDLICIRADWKGAMFRSSLHEAARLALQLMKALEADEAAKKTAAEAARKAAAAS